ncbi:MAG TPA: hypothetical protein DCW74_05910 [Alteromonas australica]|uniref:DUF669 domain-containing protein n=1 Tax=Alteromonas australica TaxID=589873 RepID=A0A350P1U1_9ALTE|nr:hypothetical protein [Alteromonas australica]|tara:strand:- start:8 stop:640 length:633 start_codon:yes stop_codon:yes gene_type:complete
MLDLNNVPPMEGGSGDFELIPDGTIVSAIIKLEGGDTEIPEYGAGKYFKQSQTTSAKWLPIELTVVGGNFDKRKVWQNIFVDGDAKDENGMSKARKIGLNTIKQMVDSGFGISPKDESENARAKRASIQGIDMINGMTICCSLGIEKGNNGYADRNKIKTVLTPDSPNYIQNTGQTAPVAQAPVAQAPVAQSPAPQPSTATAGVAPSWAR